MPLEKGSRGGEGEVDGGAERMEVVGRIEVGLGRRMSCGGCIRCASASANAAARESSGARECVVGSGRPEGSRW